MTPPLIGFDPAAVLRGDDGSEGHVGVTLWRRDDGHWCITVEDDDEYTQEISLRSDFLDEVIAQACAREADAA